MKIEDIATKLGVTSDRVKELLKKEKVSADSIKEEDIPTLQELIGMSPSFTIQQPKKAEMTTPVNQPQAQKPATPSQPGSTDLYSSDIFGAVDRMADRLEDMAVAHFVNRVSGLFDGPRFEQKVRERIAPTLQQFEARLQHASAQLQAAHSSTHIPSLGAGQTIDASVTEG